MRALHEPIRIVAQFGWVIYWLQHSLSLLSRGSFCCASTDWSSYGGWDSSFGLLAACGRSCGGIVAFLAAPLARPTDWLAMGLVVATAIVTLAIIGFVTMQSLRMINPLSATAPLVDKPQKKFFPALTRTADGTHITPSMLMKDDYCRQCHQDTHAAWSNSAHKFSWFNNPAYTFSVENTPKNLLSVMVTPKRCALRWVS